MALPTGLVAPFVFALTVGVAAPVTLGAHLFARSGGPFALALRAAVAEACVAYLVGVGVVWAAAGGAAWGVPAALVAAGVVDLVVGVAIPLLVGRWLVRRASGAGPGTALRYATYGWPLAMAVAFGLFVAPGGVGGGDLLSLGGPRTCLVGFCGVPVALAGAVAVGLAVVTFGPGAVGMALCVATDRRRHG
ncbi:MAG: hypothetical protein ABEH78_09550 [Haloferacaceae archaeon]